MTTVTIPPGRGGRLSRRVAVKLKPGPRKSEAGTITPKARSKMLKISRIAAMLVHDGVWPSPKAVADKAADLPVDTVKRYIAALDPARRLWVAKFGRHPHWDDPEAGDDAVPATGDGGAATGDAANDDTVGDRSDEAGPDGCALAEGHAPADGDADAEHGTAIGAPDPSEHAGSTAVAADGGAGGAAIPAGEGTGGPGAVTVGSGETAAHGSGGPEVSAGDHEALRGELDLANRRVERLLDELAAERDAHADTRVELANEREISARLLKGFRGPSLVYTEADAELKRRTP